ncbi:MAG: ATP-binding protein [Chloroflexota bacterium]
MDTLTDEIQSLRRSLRDLVALTTLPTIWAGSTPNDIAESLTDVLLTTCPQLDLIYVVLNRPAAEDRLELVRTRQNLIAGADARKFGEFFSAYLKTDALNSLTPVSNPLNNDPLNIAVIPMGQSGNAGIVVVGVGADHTLTELDRLALNVATNQAATALQQAQLLADLRTVSQQKDTAFAQEQAARERMASLQAITAAFSQALTTEQVGHVVVDQMVDSLKAATGVFYLLTENTSTYEVKYRTGKTPSNKNSGDQQRYLVDPNTLPITQVIRSQRPLWLESFQPQNAFQSQLIGGKDHQGAAAILPFVINGQVIGAIEYIFSQAQTFSQEDQDFILAVSHQCAQALENARLYESELKARELLQTRVKLQSIISELGQEALVSYDLPALMNKSAAVLADMLNVEFAKILELLPDENSLLLRAGVGWQEGNIGHTKVDAGSESQAGYSLQSHNPVIVEDLHTETRFTASQLFVEHHVISGVSVVIDGHQGPWGILGVHSSRWRQFTSDDVYFVQSVANILGAALERARLDSLLELQRQRLTNIIATIPGVIWENYHADEHEEMQLVFISAYVETMLGYTVEEALAERHFWMKIFHPEDAEETARAFNRVRESGGSGIINFRAVHKNGQVIDIHALMITILKDGKPIGKRGVMMDVTERQQLMNAQARYAAMLRRSNEELQQFAYVASHDLQEPLRMVTSYLQIIESRYADKLDNDAHEFIDFAIDGAARMKSLISALLEYSRVEGSEKDFKEFDSQLALEKALANLSLTIEDNMAQITYDVMPRIKADPTQITQLFQNLIGNAIKFQKEKTPEIYIGVERKQHEWQFSVRDNGIGISPEYRERIFVIFQRLHKRNEYPGTGIGLAICKKVVERHGGRIWFESVPDRGTTFYFTIPV